MIQAQTPTRSPDTSAVHETGSGVQPISVLCVDDNPMTVETLKHLIERTPGLEWAGSLSSADSVVERCRESCPNVVLLDMVMPGRDCFEAAKLLWDQCPDSRVIMYTSHEKPESIDKSFASGAWAFVSKYEPNEKLVSVRMR